MNSAEAFYAQGFIPGPNESEEAFRCRADYCLKLKEKLGPQLSVEKAAELEFCSLPLQLIKKRYEFIADWVCIFFSSSKLSLLHGGCLWVFQLEKEAPLVPLLQLPAPLKRKKRYFFIYKRDEIIAHELIHASRMAFDEPIFEEILAYRLSFSPFRAYFGPIFKSEKEQLCFCFLLLSVTLSFIVSLFFSIVYFLIFVQITVLYLIFLAVRLIYRQKQFNRCLKNIKELIPDKDKAEAVAARLTDREIINFSKNKIDEIESYALDKADKELRWRFIYNSYFIPGLY